METLKKQSKQSKSIDRSLLHGYILAENQALLKINHVQTT